MDVPPLVILAVLFIAAWFTGSKVLKMATLAAFFLLPVTHGVTFNADWNFIKDVLDYWLKQLGGILVNTISDKLGI